MHQVLTVSSVLGAKNLELSKADSFPHLACSHMRERDKLRETYYESDKYWFYGHLDYLNRKWENRKLS